MDAAAIRKVLQELRCEKIKEGPKWVSASCPFAKWTHKKGADRTPSFAVSIHDADVSFFRCHACGLKGPMYGGFNDLLWQIRSFGGPRLPHLDALLVHTNQPSPERLMRRVEASSSSMYSSGPTELAGIQVPKRVATQVTLFDEDAEIGKPLPAEDAKVLDIELNQKGWDYLQGPGRNLHRRTILHHRLTFVPRAQRIAVPMWDCKDRLVNISGRTIHPNAKPKWLHSKGFRRDLYLYGEDDMDREVKTCFLVEGMFDRMGLWQRGYPNVMCILGAYISDFQVEKVVRWFDDVVIVRDGDQAGVDGSAQVHAKLRERVRSTCRVVDPPEGLDPDELPVEFLRENLGPPSINLDICDG